MQAVSRSDTVACPELPPMSGPVELTTDRSYCSWVPSDCSGLRWRQVRTVVSSTFIPVRADQLAGPLLRVFSGSRRDQLVTRHCFRELDMNFPYIKYGDATWSHRKGDLSDPSSGPDIYSRSPQQRACCCALIG